MPIGTPWVGTAVQGNVAGSNVTTVTVDVSGATDGEVCFIFGMLSDAQTAALTAPSGWKILGQLSEGVSGAASTRSIVYWKQKASGDGNVAIPTWSVSSRAEFVPVSWPGVDPLNPCDSITWLAHSSGTSYVTGTATPLWTDRWAVGMFSQRGTTANVAFTIATLTSRVTAQTTATPWSGLMVADSNGAVTQASHNYTATGQSASHGLGALLYLVPAPKLLAAYNFDEASGNILDQSGNGNDVTFGGSFTRVSAVTGTALSQSTTAADSAGPPIAVVNTPRYTIMGRAKRTTNSVDGWLAEGKQSSSGDRGLLFTTGNVQSRCKNVAGTVFTVQTTQPTAGTDYHFACTNDGVTLRLYINGTEVGTGTAFSGGVRTNSTSSSLFDTVGAETWLDDVRYYDGALDQPTISTLAGQPVASSGITGSAAVTEQNDTSTASGVLGYSGTVARTEANDTSTASGSFTPAGVSGTVAVTQANQTASASGVLGYAGTVARTQANQTSTASGTVSGAGISGSVAATQASQTSTASGVLGYSGTVNVAQAGNVAAATGKLGYSGTLAGAQANQTSAAAGVVANAVTGSVAVLQQNQFATATGTNQPLVLFGTSSAGVGVVPSSQPGNGSVPDSTPATVGTPSASAASGGAPTSTGA